MFGKNLFSTEIPSISSVLAYLSLRFVLNLASRQQTNQNSIIKKKKTEKIES